MDPPHDTVISGLDKISNLRKDAHFEIRSAFPVATIFKVADRAIVPMPIYCS